MALIGVAIGLVIVEAAFIVPEAISERIIEPAGGTAIENSSGLSCDRVLKNQLVFQRAASTHARMNAVVKQIQAQRQECAADIWDPNVLKEADGGTNVLGEGGCRWGVAHKNIGDTDVPRGWHKGGTGVAVENVRVFSGRDSENNIIMHFDWGKQPSDSRTCWLYSDRLKTWDQEYYQASCSCS